jgi:mannose-6-phosphate isomerase-like protein (cupin superfamily)
MPRLIEQPTVVSATGTKPKQILEFVGRVNTGHAGVSVARMVSPEGWQEPGQRPEFEEVALVLNGLLRVEHKAGQVDVRAGQAIITSPGEWVRYMARLNQAVLSMSPSVYRHSRQRQYIGIPRSRTGHASLTSTRCHWDP